MTFNNEFAGILLPNERVLWLGIPQQGFRYDTQKIMTSFFDLFFFGFSLIWTVMASSMAGLFGLFGVPFMAVGFYLLVGHFIWDMLARRKTVYGVTEQRILFKEGGFSITTNTIFIKICRIFKSRKKTMAEERSFLAKIIT
jgi:membrane-bound ClpP family serine protease